MKSTTCAEDELRIKELVLEYGVPYEFIRALYDVMQNELEDGIINELEDGIEY